MKVTDWYLYKHSTVYILDMFCPNILHLLD